MTVNPDARITIKLEVTPKNKDIDAKLRSCNYYEEVVFFKELLGDGYDVDVTGWRLDP